MATGVYKRTKMHSESISRGLFIAHKTKVFGFQEGIPSLRKTNIFIDCLVCGIKIKVKPCRLERTKYCSRECKDNNQKGKMAWNKGVSNYWALGAKNINWKGGVTSVHEKLRKSVEYEAWRKKVLERDNYTCQICEEIGGELNVDHIKPFSLFPELRLDINNGRVLCVPCHKETSSYLNSNMKKEDFNYV